jgi:hypothetical protein
MANIHPYWQSKRLTPSQIIINDVRLDPKHPNSPQGKPLLRIDHDVPFTVPIIELEEHDARKINLQDHGLTIVERNRAEAFIHNYGWMNKLRIDDKASDYKCRWIHISSLFTEYLLGVLLAMVPDTDSAVRGFRALEHCILQNERSSKHGRYFNPFLHCLDPQGDDSMTPLLVCLPFLDWTCYPGPPPPPQSQIDPYDLYRLSRSSSHMQRSMLQYFYRLEETGDREREQVFSKYRPWMSSTGLQTKIQRWYQHEPTGLVVDELWMLVIDSKHIITFSSNQSWKPIWPPHQLHSRIGQVAFRTVRDSFHVSNSEDRYDALTHLNVCLSGAVGLLHRSFWADIILPLADRYGGYLSHLQYRLHRSPNTKLVMELLQTLDELNIVFQLTQQQRSIIGGLQTLVKGEQETEAEGFMGSRPIGFRRQSTWGRDSPTPHMWGSLTLGSTEVLPAPTPKIFKPYTALGAADPYSNLIENLNRELSDLRELRDNTSNLVTRTVQLVNIRLEDHGKAIMVFTIVTIVFLPLSFVTSFFGMNVSDIRNMTQNQSIFWIVAASLTTVIVATALMVAFYGSGLIEKIFEWKGERKNPGYTSGQQSEVPELPRHMRATEGFKVFGAYSVPEDGAL